MPPLAGDLTWEHNPDINWFWAKSARFIFLYFLYIFLRCIFSILISYFSAIFFMHATPIKRTFLDFWCTRHGASKAPWIRYYYFLHQKPSDWLLSCVLFAFRFDTRGQNVRRLHFPCEFLHCLVFFSAAFFGVELAFIAPAGCFHCWAWTPFSFWGRWENNEQ